MYLIWFFKFKDIILFLNYFLIIKKLHSYFLTSSTKNCHEISNKQ